MIYRKEKQKIILQNLTENALISELYVSLSTFVQRIAYKCSILALYHIVSISSDSLEATVDAN